MDRRSSSRRVYLGNIPKDRDKKEIKKIMGDVGEIVNFVCYSDEAYVEYERGREAEDAIDKINGYRYNDKKLLVEWAHLDYNRRRPPMRRRDTRDV